MKQIKRTRKETKTTDIHFFEKITINHLFLIIIAYQFIIIIKAENSKSIFFSGKLLFALQFNKFRYSYVYMINTHLRKDETKPSY